MNVRLSFLAVSALALFLAGCAGAALPPPDTSVPAGFELPAMKSFASERAAPPLRSNQQMARDFLDLTFALESGRPLPTFTRFEGGIRVAVNGPAPATLGRELDRLLTRLRSEGNVPIQRADNLSEANLVIEAVPAARLKRSDRLVACLVAPGITSWREYAAGKRVDWTSLRTRNRVAVFVPADTSPQELRDCLHEEVAQALGPVNDLYRLTDSVFNDDNFQSILTGFDMLMLRVTYDGALHSGMSQAEVAQALPAIFARQNPGGGAVGALPLGAAGLRDSWDMAITEALGNSEASSNRRSAGERALKLAQNGDARTALSWFAIGRALQGQDNSGARSAMAQALGIWQASPLTEIHAASATLTLAAHALATGDDARALALSDQAIPATRRGQNAALLAQFLMIRAEALKGLGKASEASASATEALAYARYGFASPAEIRERTLAIAALAQRSGTP